MLPAQGRPYQTKSLPAWGGWIEIHAAVNQMAATSGPSPHGEGGLKYAHSCTRRPYLCPSPHGEGGLKCNECCYGTIKCCPSPHGEGGLKFPGRGYPAF